jgi:agmatinase
MKIVGVSAINALGNKGPENMPKAVFGELKKEYDIWEFDNSNVEESQKDMLKKSRDFFLGSNKFCFVGGDHSITYPIFSSFREKFRAPFLVVMDAHADSMKPMKEPTHEEFLRAIIEDGMDPRRIILIGARRIEPAEEAFLKEKGVKVFSEIGDLEAATDYITERAMGHDVYVSIDIDVVDPAYAPGVNYPEVAGLSSRDFFYILKRLFRIKSLKAIDVVEAVPEKDEKYDNRTIKLCAKVVEEFTRLG